MYSFFKLGGLQLYPFSFNNFHLPIFLSLRSPDTLDDLKFVLKTIADVKDMSLTIEFRFLDIQERYRTLLMYNIPVREKDLHLKKVRAGQTDKQRRRGTEIE